MLVRFFDYKTGSLAFVDATEIHFNEDCDIVVVGTNGSIYKTDDECFFRNNEVYSDLVKSYKDNWVQCAKTKGGSIADEDFDKEFDLQKFKKCVYEESYLAKMLDEGPRGKLPSYLPTLKCFYSPLLNSEEIHRYLTQTADSENYHYRKGERKCPYSPKLF